MANLIIRIHGGAKFVERVIGTDDLFYKRSSRNTKKRRIAEIAVAFPRGGASVHLDSSKTGIENTFVLQR